MEKPTRAGILVGSGILRRNEHPQDTTAANTRQHRKKSTPLVISPHQPICCEIFGCIEEHHHPRPWLLSAATRAREFWRRMIIELASFGDVPVWARERFHEAADEADRAAKSKGEWDD